MILDEEKERRNAYLAYCAYHANPFARSKSFREFLPECLRPLPPQMAEDDMKQQFRMAAKKWPKPKPPHKPHHRQR